MKTLLALWMGCLAMTMDTGEPAFNFGNAEGKNQDWVMITDQVMGGVSRAKLNYTGNSMIFSGTISLANYGGFASVRTNFGSFDLSDYKGVRIKYKATNQQFALTLEKSRNWTRPNFKGFLSSSEPNTWVEETVLFTDFEEQQIGEPTGGKLEQSSLSQIIRVGIITTEKKAGPFAIEVDFIQFVR